MHLGENFFIQKETSYKSDRVRKLSKDKRGEKLVCLERFLFCHPIWIGFSQETLRILEQIMHMIELIGNISYLNNWGITQVCGKRIFNDSQLYFIFSQYYNYG